MKTSYHIISSPIGQLTLVANADALVALMYENDRLESHYLAQSEPNKKHPVLLQTEKQLKEYFKGKRKAFDLPLRMLGTDFQQQAWRALTKIPFGKTRSYQEQAVSMGSPNAVRAVGSANSKNPMSIIVPCHRVIGKNGKLTGYAGGLTIKSFLLEHEMRHA
jgi:methylated-DNA-[protein]-cysteine S-methyltransferase